MNTYFSLSYKHSSLTAKIGKPEKWKFGRIGSWYAKILYEQYSYRHRAQDVSAEADPNRRIQGLARNRGSRKERGTDPHIRHRMRLKQNKMCVSIFVTIYDHTECVTDLDSRREMIIIESI